MSVISNAPPSIEDIESMEVPKKDSFMARNSKMVRIIGTLGLVGVAAVAGFVAGQSGATAVSAEEPNNTGTDAPEVSSVELAKETISNAAPNNAVLSTIAPSDLAEAVAIYQADPAAWDDQYLTVEIMESLVTYKETDEGTSARRLGDRRDLIGSYDEALVDAAYERFESETFSGSGIISVGSDDFNVYNADGKCWLIASTSDEGADWASNLDLGSDDILAVKQTTERDESCGCDKTTLWWCSRYKSCSVYRKLGRGYDGFVKTYNNARLQLSSAIQTRCTESDIVLVGYSRGAGILSPLSYALVVDGVVPASRMTLVTFGSPRVFEDSISDKAHNVFTHWRMVHKSDIVTSVPYDWWGYKHFGTMRCMNCNYDEGRDRPLFAADIGAHTSYCTVFGNNVCK